MRSLRWWRRRLGWLKPLVPLAVRQRVFAFAYRRSGDVRFAERLANVLERRGLHDQAVAAYREVWRRCAQDRALPSRQSLQFRTQRRLHALGAADVDDPLFHVTLAKEPSADGPERPLQSGRFTASVGYLGLRVRGKVPLAALLHPAKAHVEVSVDGVAVRTVALASGTTNHTFEQLFRRPALATLPSDARLAARVVTGRRGGDVPLWAGHAPALRIGVPHGDASAEARLADGPLVDKKGHLRLVSTALARHQDAYLSLYRDANEVFERSFGRSLFLIYGTLLGRYRDGDFIPGDDDFDVGYVSHEGDPDAVKREAIEVMRAFVRAGFEVGVNRRGKPFRLRAPDGPLDLHLDARPVWFEDGRVWCHKQASLAIPLEVFSQLERVPFRHVDVAIPRDPEVFLRSYYGDGWRVPDPSFSNASLSVPKAVRKHLDRACLSVAEAVALEHELADVAGAGRFYSIATHDLYPLDVYERRVGW